MYTTLGIKLWGGRRYVVEIDCLPTEASTWHVLSKALGLSVYQTAHVVINLDTMTYMKNKDSGRTVPDTLDAVVYRHGNAQRVTPEELQEIVNDLYRNR